MKEHVQKYIGPFETIDHDASSDAVKMEILWVKPTPEKPYHMLVTSGMSDKPMNVPEGVNSTKYLELCILLSADWKGDEESLKDENYYWPIRWLKIIALFPHAYGAWLGWGHTIPNGEDFEYADSTKLSSMVILTSTTLPKEFLELKMGDKTINVLSLVPMYKEEFAFKRNNGVEKLVEQFKKHNITDIVDPTRPNAFA